MYYIIELWNRGQEMFGEIRELFPNESGRDVRIFTLHGLLARRRWHGCPSKHKNKHESATTISRKGDKTYHLLH